ncbi:hypothetical protein [Nonomuraea sp. NPDC052265]|uniref:hypothetical protein n=1 Tax=Nonomuraea sp. NPDC052265 TaxID=3364374 RepID=UPI0037C6E574
MPSFTVTNAQFAEAVKAVVEENPGRVYEAPAHQLATVTNPATCYYVHTDPDDGDKLSPGCVIGAALHRLGLSLDEIRQCEFDNARQVLFRLFPNLSADTRDWANSVQTRQDAKATWSEALDYANSRIGFPQD